ncbi:MAG TPA: PQQ-dependent sugar dehydrogenase [Thermoanaerobaculia bacterium]|jgi:glucose/arabinose dehydrogenase|nr:PQQ-dependent sugar dehydrogenase [Thermoanaerobaculia bacterium]
MRTRIAALAAALLAGIASAQTSVLTEAGSVRVESLAKLDNPWGMTYLPDGRLLISEKPGRLRIYANGKLSEPVGGVPKVAYLEQGGLLDVEIHPDFARNGLVYIYYAEAAAQQPKDAKDPGDPRFGPPEGPADNTLKGGAVAHGKLVGNALQSVKVIWRQVPKTIGRGHFGGRLVFAPDGKLFITSGERMRFDPAQDLSTNLGKIIRINPDGTIPSDNPFVGRKGPRDDVWTLGHRNPLGAAIHPMSKQLWINEMGPLGGDELNLIAKGKNYGWPIVSNGDNYDKSPIPDHPTRPEFEAPLYTWNPVISPSGMIFYTGTLFPSWRGQILMGGLSSKAVIRVKLQGSKVVDEERINMNKRIRDVIQSPDGAVLLLVDGDDGELLRLTPATKK